MRIEINSKYLASQLDALRNVVAKREVIPALANVLIESIDENKLRLTATDLDTTLQIEVEPSDVSDGVLCLSLDRLHGLVKALPDSDITIRRLDNDWAEVTTDTGKYKIPGMKRDSFPATQIGEGQSYECEGVDFLGGLSRVAHHLPDHEDGKVTQSVLFEVNGCLRFVALDGFCMSVCDVEPVQPFLSSDKPMFAWAIPSKAVKALINALNDKEKVLAWATDNLLFFQQGTRFLTVRRPEKQFPNYQMILNTSADLPAEINKDELSEALNIITSFIPTGKSFQSAAFNFKPSGLTITIATQESGEATCEVNGKFDGELTVGFYPVQLKTALSKTLGEVTFCLSDSMPMVIASRAERIKSRQLIMPVRL